MDFISILRNTHASLSANRIGEHINNPRLTVGQQEYSRNIGSLLAIPFQANRLKLQDDDGNLLFVVGVSRVGGTDKVT
jgi:hypothetical protein